MAADTDAKISIAELDEGTLTEENLPAVIRAQLLADPQAPRPIPTVSLWQVPQNPAVGSIQSNSLPQRVDFAIIGSGIAACGVSESLLTNGARPMQRHAFMAENFGVEQANKIMKLTVRGLDEMHKLAEAQGPEFLEATLKTRLEKFFAYYDEASWTETIDAVKLYEQEVPEDKGIYELVSKEDCASIYNLNGACGGLKFAAGVCSPYRLVTGTFAALLRQYSDRLSIETNTPVTGITYSPSPDDAESAYPYIVQTPRGLVRAGQVIHCTNGYGAHLLAPLRGKMYPRRGTMSVQQPGESFPDKRGKQSWSFYFSPQHNKAVGDVETGRYYGFQNRETGDLWIGGDRDNIDGFISADDSRIDEHAEKNLRTILPRLFSDKWIRPDNFEVRAIWTGIMCYTGDQLPFVGRLPAAATGRSGNGEWIAGGWNSYGMTNGFICGSAVGKMILGEDIGAWFPESYLPTEERLNGESFKLEAVLKDFFVRIGAQEISERIGISS